jgi:lipoprotein-anchoring transpeptidase ErfK/SrfK
MSQLLGQGAGGNFQSRIDRLKQRLGQIPDDAALASLEADATKLVKDMQAAYQGSLPVPAPADPGACIPDAPAYMIIIHLNTQDLTAYNNGCPWLHTLVTTGRPALPTDRGTFQIFAKYPSYHMISPWPQGSPFWYHDAWVADAMEFVSDGTFIHGASWQPNGTYGPGSQYGPYASHGCVHVAPGPLAQLYAWAPIGTTVTVTG